LTVGVEGDLRAGRLLAQPADQPRLVTIELGIGGGAGEDDLPDAVASQQLYKGIQVPRRELIQIMPVERRVHLLADAVRTAQVTRPGKEDVAKVVGRGSMYGHQELLCSRC
jgi:hypothetical protein